MMLFCPYCGNIMAASSRGGGPTQLECRVCPFMHRLQDRPPIYCRNYWDRKVKDDHIDRSTEWDSAQKTKILCTKDGCRGEEAAYYQLQIRSADEAMTIFYRCITCGHRWREDN